MSFLYMRVERMSDIVQAIYEEQDQTMLAKDLSTLSEIWSNLRFLITDTIYSRIEITRLIKEYFSEIFIAIFCLTENIIDIYEIMIAAKDKMNNIPHVTFAYANKDMKNSEIRDVCKVSAKAKIEHIRLDNLVGGWILLDEQCNLIDRSFAFLNFIR